MMNKAILFGRLGNDPELKQMPSSQKVCNFRIATSESYMDKQGVKQEITQWHVIDAWGNQAEACAKYLKKGKQVLVEGKIIYKTVEKNGEKRIYTSIKAERVQFVSDGSKQINEPQQLVVPMDDTTDIPF